MTNFKALGIETEIKEEFADYKETELFKLLKSSYYDSPYITKRQQSAEYCMIEVTSCSFPDWWYNDLIGFQFFCRIVYKDYGRGKEIVEFKGVKLTKTKEIIFRDFKPSDVMII